jgi:hypothetical protein
VIGHLVGKLFEGKGVILEDIEAVYHQRLQASKEELYEACCNGIVTEHHVFMLESIKRDIAFCEQLIEKISERIREKLSIYENAIALLKSIPGLNRKSIE